jgi:molybdopterin-containing oxidoreductase family iron-sulfur binding subunit
MHCNEAPCVEVCPSGASQKRADGIVFVDPDQCVGCRACVMACPYAARYYQDRERTYFSDHPPTPFERERYPAHPKGIVEKCDFCRHRLERGAEPACVANCMCKARTFGDLDDPESEVSQLIRDQKGFQLNAELGTEPSVYYLPAER